MTRRELSRSARRTSGRLRTDTGAGIVAQLRTESISEAPNEVMRSGKTRKWRISVIFMDARRALLENISTTLLNASKDILTVMSSSNEF